MKSFKKFLLGVFAILFGLTAGFFLIEFLLRMFAPQWLVSEMKELNIARNAESFGSDVGWKVESIDGRFVRFVPGSQFPIHYYEYNNTVHIDEWGGRVIAGRKPDAKNAPVPFLGDSFVFGIGVEDQQTFVSLLNSRANSPYIALNLGIPGSALPNQLDQIEYRHKQLHSPPVYVFTFYTGNDYSDIAKYYGKLNLGTEDSAKKPGPAIHWLDRNVYHNPVLAKSYFLQFIKRTILKNYFYAQQKVRMAMPLSCGIPSRGKQPVTSSALMMMVGQKKCIEEVRSYVDLAMRQLDDVSKRLKFHPIFVIIPDKLQVLPELLQSKASNWNLDVAKLDVDLPDKLIEQELASRGIPYFDMSDCLRGQPQLYYKIDDHLTPAGHEAVARCLSGKLDGVIGNQTGSH